MREALDPRSRSKEIILHKKLGAEYPTLKFEFLRRLLVENYRFFPQRNLMIS
jgi:hypothetical protein